MKGISAKDHEYMLEAFRRFEELTSVAQLAVEEDIRTREGMEEITVLYRNFRKLLSELDQCTKEYENRRKVVQSVMYKNIRKMNSQIRNKRYCL